MAYSSAVAMTPVEIARTGVSTAETLITPTATHGNKFLNDGKTVLRVVNGSASPITVTIDTPGSVDGQAIADLVVTIAATGDGDGLDDQFIGPFPKTFEQSDGYVWAVFSAVTDVTAGAFRLP